MSTLQLTPAQLNAAESAQWQEILRQALTDLRVAAPAIVQSFDPVKQVVAVQMAIKELVRTPNGPQPTAISPIYNVPIILPRAGGLALTLPITAGDEGMLVFCDACIDLWWARGGVQEQFERRRHDLSDCGFYPGMWNQKRVLSNYSTTSAQLRTDSGGAYIEITAAGAVNIKGNVVITGTVSSTGDGTFNGHSATNHVHGGVTSGGSDTGTAIG